MNFRREVVYPFTLKNGEMVFVHIPGNGTLNEEDCSRLGEMLQSLVITNTLEGDV